MDHLSFQLPTSFVNEYKNVKPVWGFDIGAGNSLSELTYITKYSMKKADGSKERWYETCERVINGTYSILKDHAKMNGTYWNENKALHSAKEAYTLMFEFKWTPPGRGLQNMGKEMVNLDRNSAPLINCSFISTEKLSPFSAYLATRPFVLLMEQSMNGIGVGFDTRGSGKLTIFTTKEETTVFVIEDNRESWAESVGHLLESYFLPHKKTVEFDYSLIRPAGSPLGRFGGTASGPEPLCRLHEKIRDLLDGREGEKITSTDIVDVCNLIGKAVVSGGARRSAEIALGFADDKEFLNLKNWEINPERNGADGWAHLSNNSVIFEDDARGIDDILDRVADNGEPGILNLKAGREYGRMGDAPNYLDMDVMGTNPCAEIIISNMEICNLSEVYMSNIENIDQFKRVMKFAYLYCKAVTLLPTPWVEVNNVVVRNRRIGTSVTGVTQFLENRDWSELSKWLDEGYSEILSWDKKYSSWLGVRESIKHTSVKPSGTVSIIAGVTPGVHWPVASGNYVRRQRFTVSDPMVALFAEAGYHVEPDVMDPDFTVVVEFPTAGPVMRDQTNVSLWEKAALAALLARYWADNAVSVTLTFDPDSETSQVGPVVKAYFDQLKTMSFLKIDNNVYPQMPYESVEAEKFDTMRSVVKPIDWSLVYDGELGSHAQGDKFCDGDTCLVPIG